jgi:hypothetical protein
MAGANVSPEGAVQEREVELELPKLGRNGRAACYRYRWRHKDRVVWVTQDSGVVDYVISAWWRHLTSVPLDLEYFPDSSEPAVVSLALNQEVALLWHRPDPLKARKLPEQLVQLLASERIPKVGFAIDNDIRKLALSSDLLTRAWPKGLFDIQTLHRVMTGAPDSVGMTQVVNELNSNKNRFAKMEHSGNWGRKRLAVDQILYAAGDVFVTWEVLDALGNPHQLTDSTHESKANTRDADSTLQRAQPAAAPEHPLVQAAVPEHTATRVLSARQQESKQSQLEYDVLRFLAQLQRLPRLSRLCNFLASCCPYITTQSHLVAQQKQRVAERVLLSLFEHQAIVPESTNPGRNAHNATLRLRVNRKHRWLDRSVLRQFR